VHISGGDWYNLLHNRHACDVAACSQVDSRRHGTVFVHAHEIFSRRYRRRTLGKELPSNVSMLDCHRLGMIANDVGFGKVSFRAPNRGFDKGYAIYMFWLGTRYAEAVLTLLL
jgi:hypothetical protein